MDGSFAEIIQIVNCLYASFWSVPQHPVRVKCYSFVAVQRQDCCCLFSPHRQRQATPDTNIATLQLHSHPPKGDDLLPFSVSLSQTYPKTEH